jgi:ketosteroid isomerase-like protein
MKSSKIIKASIFFLLFLSFACQKNDQKAGVEKMHELYISTIETENLDNLKVLYTEDATIKNTDGSIVSGLANIKAQYDATFSNGKYNITLKTIDETVLDKEYMFVSGSFVFSKIDEPKVVQSGQFVNTLKKVNGDWKIYKSYRYNVPSDNAAIVNSAYEAFSIGDIPAVLELFDSEIVWNEAESNKLADGNPYIGPDAVLNGVFARLGEDHEYFKLADITLHEMSNNQVLATLRYDAKFKESGKTYNAQAAHLWSLKNGKVVAFQQYVDTKKLADSEKK